MTIGAWGAVACVMFKDDLMRVIDTIQSGKSGGSLSDNPLLGDKNPIDQALKEIEER